MKLKSIYIDGLHNAVNKTYNLNDLVYLYGRNGAGKTTVLNAIQLALLGYIPGTAKNSREALLRHATGERIVVKLEIDDNGSPITIERSYTSKASLTITSPENIDVPSLIKDLELPIFNFNDFVGQTANKLKDYFIKNILPTSDGALDWEQILKNGLVNISVEDLPATIEYGMGLISNLSGSPIEQVAQANVKFKEEQSFVKSELTRLQATVDSLVYYSDYNGPRNLDDINAKLLSLGAIRDALIRYETAKQFVEQNEQERNTLVLRLTALGGDEKYNEVMTNLNNIQKEYEDQLQQIKDLELAINALYAKRDNLSAIVRQGGICPYTKDKCTGLNLDEIQANINAITDRVEANNNVLHDLTATRDEYRSKISQLQSVLSEFAGIKNKIDALTRSAASLPDKPTTDKTLQDLDREIQQYTEDRDKLKANLAYEATIDNITTMKYKSELNSEALAAWVKLTDTNGLQTTLTEKPFEELADKMTGYIQTMYGTTSLKAKFNITTKANSFSFGLVRGDKYISYDQLSSGEKCLYTLALMICITDSSSSPLKLMLCDDMFDHLDSQAVEGTFLALKNIPNIQFILAGVKDCQNASDVMIHI